MAIISRIRKYSAIAVGFIAFAIIAFVLSDLLSNGGLLSSFGSGADNVGRMAGTTITRKDFENAVKIETARSQVQEAQAREMVWNSMLYEKVFLPECERLGITVTEQEAKEMVQGDSLFIHPSIRQQFTDPQTKKFDKTKVIETLQNLGRSVDGAYRWQVYEEGLRKDRMRTKWENMMRISTYVTKAEAKRENEVQNAKADIKYLHIPFTSIPDSTLTKKITDAELQDYLNKNLSKYKAQESRSIEYVAIDVKPSKEDSTKFTDELRELAKEFAKAENDSAFAATNSETPEAFGFKSPKDIPAEVFRKYPALLKGGIYGPILDGKVYKIVKVSDTKKDSANFVVRASHILFKADKAATDEIKAKARKEAEEILAKIKGGESFEEMAKKYGSDGTAQNGGDLGWFGKGQMVKPFEDAAFGSGEGLLGNLVVTDFGYHILKITHAKTNMQYKIATINKTLEPSDATSERALAEARSIKEKAKTIQELRDFTKKNPKYILQKSEKMSIYTSNLNNIQNTKDVTRWAFGEANVGDISEPIDLKDQSVLIVATLTAKVEKDEQSINAFRTELTAEVAKQIKIKQITEKLNKAGTKGTLEEIAKKYGKDAVTGDAPNLTLNGNIGNTGNNPLAVGKAMGLKANKRSEIIIDESGIFILEGVKATPAPEVADYTQYKKQLKDGKSGMASYYSQEALKKARKVEDNRYKFY
jgi:peptidyl-prolyl cis-trans isomerase D